MTDKSDKLYLNDDALERMKIVELKGYLRQHSQSVTGKKDELLSRAKGIKLAQLKDGHELAISDSAFDSKRQDEKTTTPLGEKIPVISELKGWSDDMHQSPSFTEKDVYNYFVLKMKTKRMLRSKVYYEDGHVFGVQYNEVTGDCSHCVIRAKVMPSLPKANEKQNPNHDTWLIMSKETGNVHSANCDCTAG